MGIAVGTFHSDRGALHGITVVVDTQGPEVFVGRCDVITEDAVELLDVDVHRDGEGGRTKAEYVERAARFGVWKKHARVSVPLGQVDSIRPLGEL